MPVRKEEALPQGAVKKLHPDEREHKKDRDHRQHQHNAEGDYALLSSFASDVPRHAVNVTEDLDKESPETISPVLERIETCRNLLTA